VKFKQFLNEDDAPDIEHILKKIKVECSQYIKESGGMLLYHGQHSRNASCKYETHFLRKNKDSKSSNVGLFNLYMQKKFGLKNARNEHVMFASGEAHEYAYGPALFVFPCNGYKFLWSPHVRDFLGREHSIRGKILNYLRGKLGYDLETANLIMDKVDAAIRAEWPPSIKDIVMHPNIKMPDGKNAYALIRESLTYVYDDLEYEMGHLKSAIESQNEIMFRTKAYYGIVPDYYFGMSYNSSWEEVYEKIYNKLVEK
jgi:hypothetical protein